MLDVPAVTVYTEFVRPAEEDGVTKSSATSLPSDVQRIDGLILPEPLNATLHSYCITSDSAVFSVTFVDDANDSKFTRITCQLMHFVRKEENHYSLTYL